MPKGLIEGERTNYHKEQDQTLQSVEEIVRIIQEARTPTEGAKSGGQGTTGVPSDADEEDLESEIDVSGEFVA